VIEKYTTTNKLDIHEVKGSPAVERQSPLDTDVIGDNTCSAADLELEEMVTDSPTEEITASNLAAVRVEIEKVAERQRKITGTIQIPQPPEIVWQVLTDYEGLADFIPNLAQSRRLEHPSGGIRVEQIGSQRLMKMNFSVRVVLDLEESFPKEINFEMVEGDLKAFSGAWLLDSCSDAGKAGTNLCYRILVHPKITMPVGIIEQRLSQDLKANLVAIRDRVISIT
jgi:ribosome-associated toxin RatA of RatAB toxin-antitoxin module